MHKSIHTHMLHLHIYVVVPYVTRVYIRVYTLIYVHIYVRVYIRVYIYVNIFQICDVQM